LQAILPEESKLRNSCFTGQPMTAVLPLETWHLIWHQNYYLLPGKSWRLTPHYFTPKNREKRKPEFWWCV